MILVKSLHVSHEGDVTVVRFTVKEIVDTNSIQELGEELGSLSQSNCKILLSFDGVEFLSSAALGKFILLEKLVRSKHGTIRFCNICPEVYEVFEITRLNSLFDIKEDEVEALADY